MTSPLASHWNGLADHELTVSNVEKTLDAITDDLWAVAACADRLVDDVETQRTLLQIGIRRTDATSERVKRLLPHTVQGASETSNLSESL